MQDMFLFLHKALNRLHKMGGGGGGWMLKRNYEKLMYIKDFEAK